MLCIPTRGHTGETGFLSTESPGVRYRLSKRAPAPSCHAVSRHLRLSAGTRRVHASGGLERGGPGVTPPDRHVFVVSDEPAESKERDTSTPLGVVAGKEQRADQDCSLAPR